MFFYSLFLIFQFFIMNLKIIVVNIIHLKTIQQMKKYAFTFISLLFIYKIALSTEPYKKIIHNIDDSARCLDGSPAALYEHIGPQSNKFLIYFGGGGSCGGLSTSQTLQNCYQRSKSYLGSSKLMLDQIRPEGMSSTDTAKSRFATWSKFVFAYCDGSFHQGNRVSPVSYKDAKLYLRGANITRAHLRYMSQKYQFKNATEVVVSGISAGGIASYLWVNEIKRMFANPDIVVTVLDSAVFINDTSIQTGKYKSQIMTQNLYKLSNQNQQTPLKQCNHIRKQKTWHCFFFQNIYSLINGRVLNIISLYDAYDLRYQYQINCITVGHQGETFLNCSDKQNNAIEARREKTLAVNNKFMALSPNHSSWAISCSNHVYTGNWRFYMSQNQTVSDVTVKAAIQSFVFDKKRAQNVDSVKWPGNIKCAY